MTKPSIIARLDLVQNKISTLQHILQDTLYLMQDAHLPSCNPNDLKRALDDAESIFANLAAIRARLARTHPHLHL